jgi:hypothetical protein
METIKNAVEGYIKAGYPKKVQKILDKDGELPIASITLYRTPINSMLDKALNVISLGAFQEYKKSKGYDAFFHLYMVATLQGGTRYLIEKNEVINISTNLPSTTDKTETYDLGPTKSGMGGGIPLAEFLEKTRKKIGDHRMMVYSAMENNCQRFILDLLDANGLLWKGVREWIMQDVEDFAKENGLLSQVANTITDVAGSANKVGQDLGVFKKGGQVRRPAPFGHHRNPHFRKSVF